MFSRKKTDLLDTSTFEESRTFFRVEPSKENPIDITIEKDTYRVKSMGEGGIGVFKGEGKALEVGEEYRFKMTLPLANREISGSVKIIDVSERAFYGVFISLDEEETEQIQRYVLKMRNKEGKRRFLRVEPPSKNPIDVSIGPQIYRIKDISAGGIQVYSDGDKALETGKEYPFEMTLPLVDEVISGMIGVVDITDKTYGCAFVNLEPEKVEKIYRFVFEIQTGETGVFVRVKPRSKEPIDIRIKAHTYRIKDIGAGGIGVYRAGELELEVGKDYSFQITLSLINEPLSGIIRVVDISDTAYHCIFVDLNNEGRENIHFFVLERQKEELRQRRTG